MYFKIPEFSKKTPVVMIKKTKRKKETPEYTKLKIIDKCNNNSKTN